MDPEKCNLDGLNEEDPIKRQQMQIDNSKKLGVDTKATPEALASGHYNSNLEHTAAIYEKVHGLDPKINKGDELKRLVHTGETLDDVKHLPCDELLKRWFNHHLKNAEQPEIK
ncbi:MAG: hypothetical protein MJ252_28525 [archaeon]|nr:hypothetical protein [archaeon]